MWSKKGEVESKVPMATIEMIIGIFIILALLSIIGAVLYATLTGPIECGNEGEWDKIVDVLEEADSAEVLDEEIFYYNGKEGEDLCPLISFSKLEPDPDYKESYFRGKKVPVETTLCMCHLENNICNGQNCYNFKNIKIIEDVTGGQFNTVGISGFLNIKFEKQGNKLLIHAPNPTQTYSANYIHKEEFTPLDENLVQEMSIEYTSTTGTPTILFPYVIIKDTYPSPDNLISNIPPLKFRMMAGDTEGLSVTELLQGPTVISPEFITSANIKFLIPKEHADLFDTQFLRLYYQKGESWSYVNLNCEKKDEDLFCNAGIDFFAEQWAISI